MKQEVDIDNKLNNYLKVTGIINNTFRRQITFKKTRIKSDTTPALSTLLYSSENWTTVAQEARSITAAKIKYMTKTAGYTWTYYKTNTEIAKELNMTPILDKIQDYRKKLVATYKQQASKITKDNKTSDQTAEETSTDH
jgi:hypothetical protein